MLDVLAKVLQDTGKSSSVGLPQELQHIRQRHWHLALVAAREQAYEADLRSLIDLRLQLAEARARIAELEQG